MRAAALARPPMVSGVPAATISPRLMTDDTVGQVLRLVHVVGREDDRRPRAAELPTSSQAPSAGRRVEARRGLVEEEQLRVADDAERRRRAGAAAHPTASSTRASAFSPSPTSSITSSTGRGSGSSPRCGRAPRATFRYGSTPRPAARCRRARATPARARRVHAEHPHLAAGPAAEALEDLERGRLAGTVRARAVRTPRPRRPRSRCPALLRASRTAFVSPLTSTAGKSSPSQANFHRHHRTAAVPTGPHVAVVMIATRYPRRCVQRARRRSDQAVKHDRDIPLSQLSLRDRSSRGGVARRPRARDASSATFVLPHRCSAACAARTDCPEWEQTTRCLRIDIGDDGTPISVNRSTFNRIAPRSGAASATLVTHRRVHRRFPDVRRGVREATTPLRFSEALGTTPSATEGNDFVDGGRGADLPSSARPVTTASIGAGPRRRRRRRRPAESMR